MSRTIKNEKLVNKSNQPHGIKTPTSVEGFRNNLRKYFVCKEDRILLQSGSSPKISKMNSLLDLYNHRDTIPMFTVKVNPLKDFGEYMMDTNQIFTINGYFDDEKNYEIIESQNKFIMDYNPVWIKIDNRFYIEFFYLSLGEFSGCKE